MRLGCIATKRNVSVSISALNADNLGVTLLAIEYAVAKSPNGMWGLNWCNCAGMGETTFATGSCRMLFGFVAVKLIFRMPAISGKKLSGKLPNFVNPSRSSPFAATWSQ